VYKIANGTPIATNINCICRELEEDEELNTVNVFAAFVVEITMQGQRRFLTK
jgi:hypothetical protein